MRTIPRLLVTSAVAASLLTPAAPVIAAPAQVTRLNSFNSVFNSCNGEVVQLTGTVHIVSKQKADGFDQAITFHGTGMGSQGNEYVFNEKRSFKSADFNFVLDVHNVAVSKGSAPNIIGNAHFDSGTGEFTNEVACSG